MKLLERQATEATLVGTLGDGYSCEQCRLCLFTFTGDLHYSERESILIPSSNEYLGLKFTTASRCPRCSREFVFWPKNVTTAEERAISEQSWANASSLVREKIARGEALLPGEHFLL